MARLWVLLTWLVMAALPLQGFAAASMLFCAAATHEARVEAAQAVASGHHDHAGHRHSADPAAQQAQGPDTLQDTTHQCSLCASCCHSVAINEFPSLLLPIAAPQAELAAPFVLMLGQITPVPDKPPRA
jgi:hypothetical protein